MSEGTGEKRGAMDEGRPVAGGSAAVRGGGEMTHLEVTGANLRAHGAVAHVRKANFYSAAVLDHFMNPRNVGELDKGETDDFGSVGDPSCGDQMKLWISVRAERIVAIAFKSFGCPGAIATSSMLTVLAEGKAIDEARCITDDDVVDALGGIPDQKRHCSLLGVRALQAAIKDWERRRDGKQGVP